MEIKDWVTIGSVVAVIIGWFVSSYLSRSHDIAKERRSYRLKIMNDFMVYSKKANKTKKFDNAGFHDIHLSFLIFGNSEEIKLVNEIISGINSENINSVSAKLTELNNLIRKNLRAELKLSKVAI